MGQRPISTALLGTGVSSPVPEFTVKAVNVLLAAVFSPAGRRIHTSSTDRMDRAAPIREYFCAFALLFGDMVNRLGIITYGKEGELQTRIWPIFGPNQSGIGPKALTRRQNFP